MMRKTMLKKVSKGLLKSLGLSVCRVNEQTIPRWKYEDILEKYRTVIVELHERVSEYVLPDLGSCSGRVDLIGISLEHQLDHPIYAGRFALTHEDDCRFN